MNLPEMREITAGSVTLGVPACPSDSHLKHRWSGPREVSIPAFQLGKYPVTRGEHESFISSTGHQTPMDWDDPTLKEASLPVCGVSWQDALHYCDWLSESSGKAFRLPTADEWEKAARGGLTDKRFPWGDDDPLTLCCYGRADDASPDPVGSYEPNGYGLHEMVGNVWEWLGDLYVKVASDPPLNTPTGLPADLNRVLVGGSFMTPDTDSLWVAYRHEDPPDLRHRCLGFRLAL